MRVSFVDFRGEKTAIEAEPDESVMHAAVRNGVEAIVGECGGSLSCATCHVYVLTSDGEEVVGEIDDMEDAMLDGVASERRPNSRLCCQIKVSEDIEGLVFELPQAQY